MQHTQIHSYVCRLCACGDRLVELNYTQIVADPKGGGDGAIAPLCKRARNMFLNVSENKSSDRKL